MRFLGKVAIVTGASSGIGKGIALNFAQEEAVAVADYAHSKQKAKDVVEKINSEGGRSIAVQADISKISQVKNMVDLAKERFGQIDILVNNAGIAGKGGSDVYSMYAKKIYIKSRLENCYRP